MAELSAHGRVCRGKNKPVVTWKFRDGKLSEVHIASKHAVAGSFFKTCGVPNTMVDGITYVPQRLVPQPHGTPSLVNQYGEAIG